MFALLLLAAASAGKYTYPAAPKPQLPATITVDFGAKGKVSVPRPAPQADFEAQLQSVLMSPRGDAAAAHFCWDIPKYTFCQVLLARPGQPVLTLKNSDVRNLLWTPDGKYLVGVGVNTVRLWNLVGGVRTHMPTLRPDQLNEKIGTPSITRLWLEQGDVCVATLLNVFNTSLGYTTRSLNTTIRYAIPALKPLDTVALPVAKNAATSQEAPCHMPHTEP